MIIVPTLFLGYQPIPKNATTTLFTWLMKSLGPDEQRRPMPPKAKGNRIRFYFQSGMYGPLSVPNTPDGIAAHPDCFRFTVTRDPVRRFISMYANRVVHFHELGPRSAAAKNLRRMGLPFDPDINLLVDRLDEYREAAPSIHHHTQPMIHFTGSDLSVFDRLYDIRSLPELLSDIRSHWRIHGLNDIADNPPPIRDRQIGGPRMGLSVLSEESLEKLMTFYADDYRHIPTVDAERIRREYRQVISEGNPGEASSGTGIRFARKPRRWIRLARFDTDTGVAAGADKTAGRVLSGVVVLSESAPEGVGLRLWVDDRELPVEWGLPSGQAARRFSGSPNSGKARFRATQLPPEGGQLRLEIWHLGVGSSAVIARKKLEPDHDQLLLRDVMNRFHALQDRRESSISEHVELLHALDSVGRRARGISWLETALLCSAKTDGDPERASAWLRRLETLRERAGQRPQFLAFRSHLDSLTFPRVLGKKGYRSVVMAARFDGSPAAALRFAPTLGGMALLSARLPEGMVLRARMGGASLALEYGLPSPRFAQRHKGVLGAATARFRISGIPPEGGELVLELLSQDTGRSTVVCSRVVSPLKKPASA